MIVFVTGGAGFIGSNLIDVLLPNVEKIICMDNFDDFYEKKLKEDNIKYALQKRNYEFIEGDIRNLNLLDRIFSLNKFDIVIHLAAKAGVRPSIKCADSFYSINVNGTLNILNAMLKYGVDKMLFASSSSVYGNNKVVPFSEEQVVNRPISPYAATKLSCELLNYTYHNLYNMNIYNLRFFTVYGKRQRPDLAINKFSQKIIEGRPLTVFGDGNTARDYTYIDDIVWGILSSIKRINGYEIINLGNSESISILHLIKVLENTIGKKAVVEHIEMQPGDVEKTYADINKAKLLLGYSPKVKLEEGIKRFIEWKKIIDKN